MPKENLRILFVDDEEDDLLFFKEALDRLNISYKLSAAQSCQGVFGHIDSEEVFDIIFLDINMPVMDGKACLKAIKSNDQYKDVPVIIFTVSTSREDIDEVYNAGAHYYLIKPHAQINFVAALKMIFNIDWNGLQPKPEMNEFVINFSYN